MNFAMARHKARLTLEEAAEKLGITGSAISQWETGQTFPSTARLPKVAELYGVTIDELLREEDDDAEQ